MRVYRPLRPHLIIPCQSAIGQDKCNANPPRPCGASLGRYHPFVRDLMLLPIDQITFDDVVAFCLRQTPENVRLEYKAGFSSKDRGKQVAKEVAAFANTQGGTMIFGVAEASDRKPEASPNGQDLGTDPKAAVRSACVHNIFPPVIPEVSDYLSGTNDTTRGFLVVRVGASEDIHTIDGGRGIYLRADDQCAPVQATLEQIEWMLQRRARSFTIQQARRDKEFDILRAAASAPRKAGDVEVFIGPKIGLEPLLEARVLRDRAGEFSVKSLWASGSVPTDPRFGVKSIPDGVYSASSVRRGFDDFAGCIDVFGNVALVTRLLQNYSYEVMPAVDTDKLPHLGTNLLGVDAAFAIERVLCVVRVASRLYAETGFVGLVNLAFRAPNVAGYPLVFDGGHRVSVLGVGAPSSEVAVEITVPSSELARDSAEMLEPFVQRILWAWGCMDDKAPKYVLDMAERAHYGETACACNRRRRPRSRETCIMCRIGD